MGPPKDMGYTDQGQIRTAHCKVGLRYAQVYGYMDHRGWILSM